jgi:HAD superfamily hydrolase (TIGR01549 family)
MIPPWEPSQIKAIFFDAGNTLIFPNYSKLVKSLAELDIIIEEKDFMIAEYRAKAKLAKVLKTVGEEAHPQPLILYFDVVFQEMGLTETDLEKAREFISTRGSIAELFSNISPSTYTTLDQLQKGGYILGIVSNADGNLSKALDRFELSPYFRFIIDSKEVNYEKPDPRIFFLALERAQVQPYEAVHVGDIYPVDVLGARRAGIFPILVDPLGYYNDLDCLSIKKIDELLTLFPKISA